MRNRPSPQATEDPLAPRGSAASTAADADAKAAAKAAVIGLHEAIVRNDPVAVADWVRKGADVNARQRDVARTLDPLNGAPRIAIEIPCDALMRAARFGFADCVRALLPASDLSAVDSVGRSALMRAASAGHADCVRLLLPGSETCLLGKTGGSALSLAAAGGHIDCVETILRHASPTDVASIAGGALIQAAFAGSAECVQALLAHADARAQDPGGGTALMAAAMTGRPACVELLLPHSDPKARNRHHFTALMIAARGHSDAHAQCLTLLLRVSDVHATNVAGQTALQVAIGAHAARMADLLAPHSPRAHAEAAYQLFGPEKMPGWAPFLAAEEQAVLRAEMAKASTRAPGSIDSVNEGIGAVDNAARKQPAPRRSAKRV